MIQKIRLLVIGIGCLIAGTALVMRHFQSLPTLDSLTQVSGIVGFDTNTRYSRHSQTSYCVFVINGGPKRYDYLEWFPEGTNITSLVIEGDPISIWVDKTNWIWQVEQNGRIVIPYSAIRDAVASNERFDLLMGLGAIGLGVFGLVKWQRLRTTSTLRAPVVDQAQNQTDLCR